MQQSKRRRLSANAWREMLAQFESSGLTAQGFCQQHGISVASLKRWQLKLRRAASDETVRRVDSSASPSAVARFVDLGALRSSGSRLELRLDIGGGVVLQLSRG